MRYFEEDWDYDYDMAHEGWVREEDIPNLDLCKTFLEGILEAVYKAGDIEKLEDCLDELCGQLDVQMIASRPILTKQADAVKATENNIAKEIFDLGVTLSKAQAEQLHIRS